MIEYKTQKKERYYSKVIHLYSEFGYSIQEVSTHTGGIKKGWISYRGIAIINLKTANIISNK